MTGFGVVLNRKQPSGCIRRRRLFTGWPTRSISGSAERCPLHAVVRPYVQRKDRGCASSAVWGRITSSRATARPAVRVPRKSPSLPISLIESASAPAVTYWAQPRSSSVAKSVCGAVIAKAGPTIVLSLSIEPDTKPPRALAEGGFATLQDVADGLSDRGVFQSARHVADRRQAT